MKASGQFEVNLSPLDSQASGQDGIKLGRMAINKTFTGDLRATSEGEMLSAMTAVKNSAAYVAIEQVSGTLAGKRGSFVLQHYGVMDNGRDILIVEVVPDSGTGELGGLRGTMKIKIDNGQHYYEFEYEFK